MTKKSLVSILLGFLFATAASAAREPTHETFGLRLGMSEQAAHKRLHKIAIQQKEEKEEEEGGEQEVWILKRDASINYALTKFSSQHRLTWITVVAHPKRVRFADIASLDLATKVTDGINYSYKWKVAERKQEPAFMIIARGTDAEFLTSYSLYFTR